MSISLNFPAGLAWAKSPAAQASLKLVLDLQQKLAHEVSFAFNESSTLRALKSSDVENEVFGPVYWLRDRGNCGGGVRLESRNRNILNQASINVSQVHYESLTDKKLNSATALSAIIHPVQPYAPSLHFHISFNEFKNEPGFWRVMADVNPHLLEIALRCKELFSEALRAGSGTLYDQGCRDGDEYFYIPALDRHRGAKHFYLEEFRGPWPNPQSSAQTEDSIDPSQSAFSFLTQFATKIFAAYRELVKRGLDHEVKSSDFREQLVYHTLYFFQVLTLDRGTTAGLLVHSENDLGILGSLPRRIDVSLLRQWLPLVRDEQKPLLLALISALGSGIAHELELNDAIKINLCGAVREFYREHPSAQEFLAKCRIIPKTVSNHD